MKTHITLNLEFAGVVIPFKSGLRFFNADGAVHGASTRGGSMTNISNGVLL